MSRKRKKKGPPVTTNDYVMLVGLAALQETPLQREMMVGFINTLSVGPPTVEASCILCGCTDSHACEGGCGWVVVVRRVGLGVCSTCAPHAAAPMLTAAARMGEWKP